MSQGSSLQGSNGAESEERKWWEVRSGCGSASNKHVVAKTKRLDDYNMRPWLGGNRLTIRPELSLRLAKIERVRLEIRAVVD